MEGLSDFSHDAFLGGRLHLWQSRSGYRAGTDAVLLAATVDARKGDQVLDLGCGAGAASLCLASRVEGLTVHGLEIQPDMAGLARRNAADSGLPLQVFEGDVAQMPADLRQNSYDFVISNPPYYLRDRGSAAPDVGRETALGETVPLDIWIDAGARRLKPKGYLQMVLKADRLADGLNAIGSRLGSISVLPLAPRSGRDADLVILRARKGGKARLRLHAPVILHKGAEHPGDKDHYTAVVSGVLRRGDALGF